MICLVTGGASSGKSALAESLCQALGGCLVYLAAMQPHGEEAHRRIRRHRALRAGKGFETIECHGDFGASARDGRLDGATVLLECLGNVVANELFREGADASCRSTAPVRDAVARALDGIARRSAHLVVVGNEVGGDGVPYPADTRRYQELLGELACGLAMRCDLAVECVSGVPVVLKGLAGAGCAEAVGALLEPTARRAGS